MSEKAVLNILKKYVYQLCFNNIKVLLSTTSDKNETTDDDDNDKGKEDESPPTQQAASLFSLKTTININNGPYRFENYCIIIENRKNYVISERDNTKASGRYLSHDGKIGFSCHAEMNALNNFFSSRVKNLLENKRALKGIKVYSIRAKYNRDTNIFEISDGKPCLRCMLMLSKWGLSRNSFYSTDRGEIVRCKDEDISTDEMIRKNFRLSSGDLNKDLRRTIF